MTPKNYQIVFSVLLLLMTVRYQASGQDLPLDKKIDIALNNVTIEQAIRKIEELTETTFSYSVNTFPREKKIDLVVKSKTAREVLIEILKNTRLQFVERNENIII